MIKISALDIFVIGASLFLIFYHSITGIWKSFHRKENKAFWVMAHLTFLILGTLLAYPLIAYLYNL